MHTRTNVQELLNAKLTKLVLLAVVALLATACGNSGDNGGGGQTESTLLERAREEGIRIGFANERPYGFESEQGEPDGEAPAVAREVLDRMGITEIDGVVVEFGALINGLRADRYDMVAAGMFINEERASQALFSDPDYCATSAFAVPAGNPQNLTDFESVASNDDVTLGVINGGVEVGYAEAAAVPAERLSKFDATADVVDALRAGRIDAFALTSITVRDQVKNLPGFEATEGFIPVVNGEEQLGCGGFVFRFEDKEFRDAFNEELDAMKQADEILPLIEEFGFTSTETEAAKDQTVEDLIGQPYDFGMDS
ncbi:MAG TPA: ectoine/hydroxyectoine ABC transporter substrate-binding protein EhuB [Actinomycetota bacterium]|nr:ectoine/hydroxyectoine ABC transporter substrate-binding protein EhuB [Actinomycetota bacterium]